MTETRARGWPLPVAFGLLSGFLAGVFGIGGGAVLVLLMVLVLQRPQHVAHATSLVAIAITAVAAATRFAFAGAVAWAGAGALAVGAVAGTRLGVALLPRVSEARLKVALALLAIAFGVRLLVFGIPDETGGAAAPALDLGLGALHALGGVVAGFASATFGIGGGVIVVPLLVLAFGYGQHAAEGTSLAMIIPTAIAGAAGHHRSGYTDWRLGAQLGVGGLVGGIAGAQTALSVAPDPLARAFGVLQIVMALLLLRRRGTQGVPVTGP